MAQADLLWKSYHLYSTNKETHDVMHVVRTLPGTPTPDAVRDLFKFLSEEKNFKADERLCCCTISNVLVLILTAYADSYSAEDKLSAAAQKLKQGTEHPNLVAAAPSLPKKASSQKGATPERGS